MAHKRLRPSPPRVLWLVSGLALIAASLWVLAPGHVQPVRAAGVCTGWTSNVTPPSTIRVLRSSGAASGTVQTVDFRSYVRTVIAAEWSPGPLDAMRVGALAVKQYAWYWTMVWRGKKAANGDCYDVVDTTNDQIYRPEKYTPAQSLIDAIDATWTTSLRKNGRLFDTGYRTGASVACGADADGNILYQASLYKCAKAGETFDQLIHRYLDPVEIVRPGVGDSTGDGLGDIAVVTSGGDTTNVRLYSAGQVVPPPTVTTTIIGAPVALPIAPAHTIFRAMADVTGDRLDDLLILQRLDDGHYQIWVAPSVGDGFGPPQLWWESAISNVMFVPGGLIRFAVGDFTGDGRADAGLLVAGLPQAFPGPAPTTTAPSTAPPTAAPTPTPTAMPAGSPTSMPTAVIGDPFGPSGAPASETPTEAPTATPIPTPAPTAAPPSPPIGGIQPSSTFWVLPGTGSSLGAATAVWTGPLELDGTTVLAGDVDDTGRADLIVQEDRSKQPGGGSGVRYAVIRAGAANLSAPETWLDVPDLAPSTARTVVADVNRDGRTDVVVDRSLGTSGSEIDGYLSSGSAFTVRSLWKNASTFRWSASRIVAADLDGDGRGDIVVLYNAGSLGSRLYRFLSTGTNLKSAGVTTDPTLPWAGAAPY